MRYFYFCIIFLMSSNAFSCSCHREEDNIAPEYHVIRAFQTAKFVFKGKAQVVLNVKKIPTDIGKGTQSVNFKVLDSWKGDVGTEFNTETNVECCVCGFSVEQGKEYLIYISKSGSKINRISKCGHSGKIDQKKMELDVLDNIRTGVINPSLVTKEQYMDFLKLPEYEYP